MVCILLRVPIFSCGLFLPYLPSNLNSQVTPPSKWNIWACTTWKEPIPSPAHYTWVSCIYFTLSPSSPPTAEATMEARLGEPWWWQEQSCFVTGSQTSDFALKAQERLHQIPVKKDQSWGGQTRLLYAAGSELPEGSPTSFTAEQMQYIREVTINQINSAAEASLEVSGPQKLGAFTWNRQGPAPAAAGAWPLPRTACHVLDEHRTSNKVTD